MHRLQDRPATGTPGPGERLNSVTLAPPSLHARRVPMAITAFTSRIGVTVALLISLLAGGCATTVFDAPERAERAEEQDETLSWWRLPDRSGRFEPRQVADANPSLLSSSALNSWPPTVKLSGPSRSLV